MRNLSILAPGPPVRPCPRRSRSHRPLRGLLLLALWALGAGLSAGADPPAEASAEARLLSQVRQLTFAGQRSGEGYFSADGRYLVFQSERQPGNPFYQIYRLDLVSGQVERLSPGVGKATCAWLHPRGDRVLFASTHEDPQAASRQKEELEVRAAGKARRYSWDYDENFEIYERDLTTGRMVNLTRSRGYDAEGSYSPDGRLVVFASNRHAYGRGAPQDPSAEMDIYLMAADGSGPRRLTEAPGYDGGPFFSADGSRICWRRFSLDGSTAEIFTMRTDGSDPRQLTRLGAMSWAPFFHPSGDYLIFSTNLQGHANFELYLVDAEGKRDPVRVTHTPGFDGLPAFSPDGRLLTWTSNRAGKSQIFLARWNDAEARRLLGLAPAPLVPEPRTLLPVDPGRLRQHVEALTAQGTEGRLTGTAGERQAAAYVAEQFRRLGLLPAGDSGTYFQDFEFTAGVRAGPANRLVARGREWTLDRDWRPLAFSATGPGAPAPVVFAGYGIVAPAAGAQAEYDSYAHLDVKDRWVLVLRFLPEDVPAERRQHLARYSGLRYKAMVARDRGARGLLVASGPRSQVKEQLVPLTVDAALAGSSLPVLSISDELAQALLGERSLAALQESLDGGQPVPGFLVPEATVEATVDLIQEKRRGRNVLARLPASQGRGEALVMGAHLDHLGRGQVGSSLARGAEQGQIHPGADDNASGVAALLEVAALLARQGPPRHRDLLFAAWSGEEIGILGSSHFARTFPGPRSDSHSLRPGVAAYLNLDMVGRLDRHLILQGLGSSPAWAEVLEEANAPVGLPLSPAEDSYLPTDSTSFYVQGVPVLNFFTGAHSQYHTPRDTADLLNYEGAARVAWLAGRVVRLLEGRDQAPEYRPAEKPQEPGERAGLRAYLGTIPDYAPTEVLGVPLAGVARGGPAEQAGLRQGDIIVELAGRKVDNIYDYTYAMEALKIGQPTTIVVRRDGQRLEFTIVPVSRQ